MLSSYQIFPMNLLSFFLGVYFLSGTSALRRRPPIPACPFSYASPPRMHLSELLWDVENCAVKETSCMTVLENIYDFLEWVVDKNITQHTSYLFKCNTESWLTFHAFFPWETDYHFPEGDECQRLFDLVQSCPKLSHDDHITAPTRNLIKSRCQGLPMFHFSQLTSDRVEPNVYS
jgi:hypothetical protein